MISSEKISLVGVIGAGTMGTGISQLLLQNGIEVLLYDIQEQALPRSAEKIRWGLEKSGKEALLKNLTSTTQLRDLSKAEFIIEAAQEDLKVKQTLFKELGERLPLQAVLATNTSSISIEAISSAIRHPERVVGMHFFNPAPLIQLIEVVRAEASSSEAVEKTISLARLLQKTPILVKDRPGFIANRVARPFYLSAMRLLESGAASIEEVDEAVREGGFRMGPLELMDLIGLDVNLSISSGIYEALGKPERLRPCEIQKKLVEKKALGRKSGSGFYLYAEGKKGEPNPAAASLERRRSGKKSASDLRHFILEAVIEEARIAEKEGVASREDIDLTMKLGMNWPKGPFEWSRLQEKVS